MSVPFQQRDLILLFEDALPEFAGGLNSKTHTTIRPTNDADEQSADTALALHVHELASYYWTSNEQWIVQGQRCCWTQSSGIRPQPTRLP